MSSDGVLKSAGRMSLAILISRVLGLAREQVFAFMFGASHAMDAFTVAFRIPNLLRDLFAEGAMSAALVPTFTRTRIEEGEARAWQVARRVFWVLFAVASVISVLGILAAPWLVHFYAGAFEAIPGKFDLAVSLTRVLYPFFPLVALAAAFMGVLNACGAFFLPAFASALFNFSSITVGVIAAWFAPHWGIEPIYGMAVGVVVGGGVQAVCQWPALKRHGYSIVPIVGAPDWRRDPRLKQMLWLIVPGTVGLAATQINLLVNTVLATQQGPGAVSWLSYAFRLMQFPIGLFGVAMGAAALPRVSELWVKRDLEGISQALTRSLLNVFAINLPAAAGLAALGVPIVRILFEHGRFTANDTQATALALAMYSVGLAAYSGVKVLVPACYALGNTRIAVTSSILSVGITIALNLLWVDRLGYWGLALGTSLAAIFNQFYLILEIRRLLRRHGSHWGMRAILWGGVRQLWLAILMGGACWWSWQRIEAAWPELSSGKWAQAATLFVLICEGVLLTLCLAVVFRLRETTELANVFTIKIKKKLSGKRN